MKANNLVRSFTACMISLCLSGWSLVSSAAASTIVVTTNLDVVDSPFNADGLCGSGGTVADLPGADGKVSLREAIIAANNTPGQKTIKFAPGLSGSTIVLTGPLYLCGGHTTLNGDVTGDETPDVTIDGAAVAFPFDVIGIVSSHNTVKNLQVLALPNCGDRSAISITTTPAVATTVMDNTIAHNTVNCLITVGAGLDEFHGGQSINNVTIKHTRVQDNTVSGSVVFGILTFNYGRHNAITDLTISGNEVSGTNGRAIRVVGGWENAFLPDDGASDNLLEVTIKDNLVTGNSVPPGDVAGIYVTAGAHNPGDQVASRHNQVYAKLLNNTIRDNNGAGILAAASWIEGGADNYLALQIRGNHVENNAGVGIVTYGGAFESPDARLDLTIKDNTITGNSNPGDTAGIAIVGGGFSSPHNQVNAQLLNNTIKNNIGNGIAVGAGLDDSSNNNVEVTIRDNKLENNAGAGIVTYGAIGAIYSPNGDSSGNSLNARIKRNTVKNASLFGLWVFGGLGSFGSDEANVANGNEVHAIVTDNTITGTAGEGMNLEAGSSGEANDNEVEVSVRKNTVCGSTEADIHAIGGLSSLVFPFFPDNTGTENTLEGEISKNTTSTIVVENGAAGNVADVTQSKNVPCPE